MITPVENGSTCLASQPINFASASQLARAATSPGSPVPAFALPVLTTSARTPRLPGQMFAAHKYRCSGKAVLREHTCNARAVGDAHDQQILAAGLSYSRFSPAEFNHRQQRTATSDRARED